MLFLLSYRRPRVTDEPNMVTCILKQSLSEGSASLTILLTGALFLLGRRGRQISLGFWPQQIAPPTHTRLSFFFFFLLLGTSEFKRPTHSANCSVLLSLCICQQDA